jgi:hypothetical protein
VSQFGFTITRLSKKKDEPETEHVCLKSTFKKQLRDIKTTLTIVMDELNKRERMHKQNYNKKLSDLFGSISYHYRVITEQIESEETEYERIGGLESLSFFFKNLETFRTQLDERKELNQERIHELSEYEHALDMLKSYLNKSSDQLTKTDARIYLFYVREMNKYFQTIAEEIDCSYQNT